MVYVYLDIETYSPDPEPKVTDKIIAIGLRVDDKNKKPEIIILEEWKKMSLPLLKNVMKNYINY